MRLLSVPLIRPEYGRRSTLDCSLALFVRSLLLSTHTSVNIAKFEQGLSAFYCVQDSAENQDVSPWQIDYSGKGSWSDQVLALANLDLVAALSRVCVLPVMYFTHTILVFLGRLAVLVDFPRLW